MKRNSIDAIDLRGPAERADLRVPRRQQRSPIGVYEVVTHARMPEDALFVAVVALATVRGDWCDDGAALRRASTCELVEAHRLLVKVIDNQAVAAQLEAEVLAETIAAAQLLASERGARPNSRRLPV
jgi:hypothetical protein